MIIKRIKTNARAIALSFAAFVVAISGVAAVGSTPASAASETCASKGYSVRGTYGIYQERNDGTRVKRTGTLEVYYKKSTGKNCVMAQCFGTECGKTEYRVAAIRPSGQTKWDEINAGYWDKYAGPAETLRSTAGRCIDVYARFGATTTDTTWGETQRNNVFCG
jgi:hypothetical protein